MASRLLHKGPLRIQHTKSVFQNRDRTLEPEVSAYGSGGGGISTPYSGASAKSLSMSPSSNGRGDDSSVPGLPTSSTNLSKPAGTINVSNLAGRCQRSGRSEERLWGGGRKTRHPP